MTKPKAPKKRVKAGQSPASADSRRALFVEAFLSNNGNATNAALAAGFAPKAAACQGSRLLKNVKVRQLIDSRQQETLSGMQITTARVLEETARLAFSDPRQLIHKDGPNKVKVKTPDELDDATAAAIQSVEIDEYGRVKYKFWDKNTASERLFKHLNLYKENNKGLAPVTQVAIVNLVPLEPIDSGLVVDVDS